MSEYDDALLAKAAEGLDAVEFSAYEREHITRAVLDVVAPLIAAQALREAADELDRRAYGGTALNYAADIVRARADRIEGRQDAQEAATGVSSPSVGLGDGRELHGRDSGFNVVAREEDA